MFPPLHESTLFQTLARTQVPSTADRNDPSIDRAACKVDLKVKLLEEWRHQAESYAAQKLDVIRSDHIQPDLVLTSKPLFTLVVQFQVRQSKAETVCTIEDWHGLIADLARCAKETGATRLNATTGTDVLLAAVDEHVFVDAQTDFGRQIHETEGDLGIRLLEELSDDRL